MMLSIAYLLLHYVPFAGVDTGGPRVAEKGTGTPLVDHGGV
ncbi:hypothetical protein [Frankia sp. CcWB2]